MAEEDGAPPEDEEDDQAWLATFADLMSLLMCFFVLLLSFSEMDVLKYRQIAGSLRMAFGVQKEIRLPEPPKGTSHIQTEYTPGKPIPSPIKVMQVRRNENLERRKILERIKKQQDKSYRALTSALRSEIDTNLVDVLRINGEVVVRIKESESFKSGSAILQPSIYPILSRIADSLKEAAGRVVVGGHTDNVPIRTTAYPSNWVLSSARAAAVVHHLDKTDGFAANQVEIRAYADTRPIADNNSAENRAINRRVEIIVSPHHSADSFHQIPGEPEPPLAAAEEEES
jgi:chemotaxis protein MotB